MLPQRVAVSIVGIPVIIGLTLLGGPLFTIIAGFVLIVAALEFYAATDPTSAGSQTRHLLDQRPLALIGAAGIALLIAAADNGLDWWTRALALLVLLPFLPIILRGEAKTGLQDWLWMLGGLMYVGFLGSHLILLRDVANGSDWVLLALFATFATDTSAYFVGRLLGRTKIAPSISPGKTLEGALAGFAAGLATVLILNWALDIGAGLEIIPLAFLLPALAQFGDLAESLIKRGAGVKDASHAIPGHGGLLDRLDSVLFTAPLVYYYLTWIIL
ncbi:MAG: phosphatidate cytidylyltransferase [Chloroflexi bacterium]|nr:phosphatidate cytidylyltransferase [Chloroflexota bacterium]